MGGWTSHTLLHAGSAGGGSLRLTRWLLDEGWRFTTFEQPDRPASNGKGSGGSRAGPVDVTTADKGGSSARAESVLKTRVALEVARGDLAEEEVPYAHNHTPNR